MRGCRNVRPNVQKMSLIFLLKNIWIITTVFFSFEWWLLKTNLNLSVQEINKGRNTILLFFMIFMITCMYARWYHRLMCRDVI